MKKLILLLALVFITSCTQNTNPKFDTNLELTKAWFEKWEKEDIEGLTAMISESLEWQGAFYSQKDYITEKSGLVGYISGWLDAMEDINYEAEYFLPGVNPETNQVNGSVRTYGTWTGKNTASGKPFEVKFYHYFNFDENGLVIQGGDYGDATGVLMAVQPDSEG